MARLAIRRSRPTIPGHDRRSSLWSHVSHSNLNRARLMSRNVDHFFFIDVHELESTSKLMSTANTRNNLSSTASFLGPELLHGPHLPSSSRYNAFGRGANTDLGNELKKDFGEMPGPNNLKLKDYTVINVHTSVIPTYFPGIRIYS